MSLTAMKQIEPLDVWKKILEAIFKLPASVVMIKGEWKCGKTDFALRIAEDLLKWHIIEKVGSNIPVTIDEYSYLHGKYTYITNMPTLKQWLWQDRIDKLFIYDESVSSASNRRSMSGLNVAWLDVVSQLSKGKGKLIAICHTEDYLESVFYNPTFLRAEIEKLDKKRAVIHSPLLPDPRTEIYDIPRTKLVFDPYRIATFKNEGEVQANAIGRENSRVLLAWLENPNFGTVGRLHGLHQEQVKRIIVKEIKSLISRGNEEEIRALVTEKDRMSERSGEKALNSLAV